MANQEHLRLIERGVENWNKWFKENRTVIPDLRGADFTGRDFSGINLKNARLREAKFNRAKLKNAKLDRAYLRRADLTEADLTDASLSAVNLRRAIMHKSNLTNAYLRRADLSYADLSEANLTGAILEYVKFVDTNLEKAILKDCFIYGISVWNLKGTPKEQTNLVITSQIVKKTSEANPTGFEPTITVDDLEVAQFIYFILTNSNLRKTINAVTTRGVLLLGRFESGGLEVLRKIAEKLRELNYLPIIFDFDRPESQVYTETIQPLAKLSRFVIVDLSGPSVPQELQATVPTTKIPFVSIIEKDKRIPSLIKDFEMYSGWLTPTFVFANTEELISGLPSKIIAPAEERHKEIRQKLAQIYSN